MNFIKSSLILLTGCSLCLSANSDLNQIQQQIKQQQAKITNQKQQQANLQASLKNQQTQINQLTDQLTKTELSLKETNQQINEINQQINKLEKQQANQKNQLAKQLEAIYRLGLNPSLLERVLSDTNQHADRMKIYYQHLHQARLQTIENLTLTQNQLAQQQKALATQQQKQQSTLKLQKTQQQQLQQTQQQQQTTLEQLNQSLVQDQDKLARLKANEEALYQEIQRAEQQARLQEQKEQQAKQTQTTPKTDQKSLTQGLGAAKHQYNMPVSGSVLHSFGAIQAGELRWKGMVISAKKGTAVKAIATGRVILASYLNGYGNIVILKHGENDLSLYAFNQAIVVKEGQTVTNGQKIAEIGNTGSLNRAALYFEIRRKGVPVNPAGWIKK